MPDTDIMPLRSELVALRRTLARLEQQAGLEPTPLVVPSEGYRLVNPGDVVAADDHNMVMAQSIPRFASAVVRNAAITAPVEGMYSYLKDVDLTQMYDGAAWAVPKVARHILRANRSAALSFSATGGTWAVIPLETKLVDQSAAYNTGTGNYVCPATGLYLVSGQVGANVTAIATTGVSIYKNGAGSRWAYVTHGVASSGYTEPHCTLIESCTAGDTLALWGNCSVASQAMRPTETMLSIVYLGPL